MQLCNGFDRVFNLTTFSTRGSRWRKVPAIGWFVCSTGDSATSSHRITDIWFGETVGSLCVFIIISLISLFLSLSPFWKCAPILSLHQRHLSSLERFSERVFWKKEKKTRDSVCTHSLAAPTAIPFGLSETWTAKSISRRRRLAVNDLIFKFVKQENHLKSIKRSSCL